MHHSLAEYITFKCPCNAEDMGLDEHSVENNLMTLEMKKIFIDITYIIILQ